MINQKLNDLSGVSCNMLNIFKFHIVFFNNYKYGCRKLTLKGWVYLMNKPYIGFTELNYWTQSCVQFDSKFEADAKLNTAKMLLKSVLKVK